MSFTQDEVSCTCTIYRKDRSHPIEVTEYMSECKRNVGPWQSHPKRMLRHKAMIQCARLAFGFVGVYDQDEAERIVEKDITPHDDPLPIETSRTESVKARIKKVKTETVDTETGEVIDSQDDALKTVEKKPAVTFAQVADSLAKAKDIDVLDVAADLITAVQEDQQDELREIYNQRREALSK